MFYLLKKRQYESEAADFNRTKTRKKNNNHVPCSGPKMRCTAGGNRAKLPASVKNNIQVFSRKLACDIVVRVKLGSK